MKVKLEPKNQDEVDEMLPEYDFSARVTGKYYERYRKGTNVVLLEPDVPELFPNSEAVNKALRAVGELGRAAKMERWRGV
jgi:hypothetical protein